LKPEKQFDYAVKGIVFYEKKQLKEIARRVMVNEETIEALAAEFNVYRSSIHRCLAKIEENFDKNCKKDDVCTIQLVVKKSSVKSLRAAEKKLLDEIIPS
jgi:predicted DNA binding protein